MRRFLTSILILVVAICYATDIEAKPHDKKQQYPTMFAHRGCWSKNAEGEFVIPENSVAAVAMAKRMGYVGIECDVHYTKDKRMVILHDATLNRTACNAADYSKLDKPVRLADLTFEELRRDYVLESANPELRTPIPTLEELLEECKRQGVIPMLHSEVWESYEVAQKMFGDAWICFTGGVEHMQKVREFSDCTILLAINDGTAEENIARLKQIGGHCGISTMNYKLYTAEFCKALTDAGYEVQASIFPRNEAVKAQKNGITYQLTDFSFMPAKGVRPAGKLKFSKIAIGQKDDNETLIAQTVIQNCEYGGVVIDLKFKGDIKLWINRKITIPLSSEGDVTQLCIGERIFNSKGMSIEVMSPDKETLVEKMQIRLYDMAR